MDVTSFLDLPDMSEEEIIFRKNYCKIVKAISEPDKFAAQLYAAGLITTEKIDEVINKSNESSCSRAMRLASATENAIKHHPKENFRKFIKVLCEESGYESLARSIHPELSKYDCYVLVYTCKLFDMYLFET